MKINIRIPNTLIHRKIFGKKAFYFTMEAVIALMILSIGFGILLYLFTVLAKPPVSIVQTKLYDTVTLFSMKIESISGGNCSATSDWTADGNITVTSNSILNQAGEFYYRYSERNCDYCDDLLEQCLREFADEKNIEDENIEIRIDKRTWYYNGTMTQENASVVFPYKMLLFGTYNNSAMWGPYVAEVRVWQ